MTLSTSRDDLRAVELDLDSAHEEIRRMAVERLLHAPVEEALPLLSRSLGDASWRVRKAAVHQLAAATARPDVVHELIRALADEDDPGRRNAALEALAAGGTAVVSAAVEGLDDPDADVRKQLVDTLACIGDEAARVPLLLRLEDGDVNVRAAAADALGVIGGERVVEALLAHAGDLDEDALVRASAIAALANLQATVAPHQLADAFENPLLRAVAHALLARSDAPEAFALLLAGLKRRGRSSRLAAMAALLEQCGAHEAGQAERLVDHLRTAVASLPEFVPWACEQLATSDLGDRLVVVRFLALVRDERALIPILQAGRDPAIAEFANAAATAFGEIAAGHIDAAWNGMEPDVRTVACRALADLDAESAAPRLLEALADPDADLRVGAAQALGRLGVVGALPRLLARIDECGLEADAEAHQERAELLDALLSLVAPRDDHPGLERTVFDCLSAELEAASEAARVAIARVIARAGGDECAPLLTQLLRDASPLVRREAAGGFARLDAALVGEGLRLALADESVGVRMAAARSFSASGNTAIIEELEALAASEVPEVAAAALRSAGEVASEVRAPAAMARVVAWVGGLGDSDPVVAIAALEALERIATADAGRTGLLFVGRPENEVRHLAVVCAGRHAERPTLAELIPLVADPAWEVRAAAVRVLGERNFAPALASIARRLEAERDATVRDEILRALRRLES